MTDSVRRVRRAVSPTYSEATTRASQFDMDGTIITRSDLRQSAQAYEQLLAASGAYRTALLTLSNAAGQMADAIQACSSLKGCEFASVTRQGAAAGFHYLFANHLHVLSDSIERKFERPTAQKLAEYKATVMERSDAYERALRERSKIIRQTEEQSVSLSRRKERNMTTFRAALQVLQAQVDDIDRLKVEHYGEVEEHESEFSEFVQGKVAVVVRSTFEIFDKLASKSTDPILEPMLQSIPDPFDSYGPPKGENEIFSVLQPLALHTEVSLPGTPGGMETPSTTSPLWADSIRDAPVGSIFAYQQSLSPGTSTTQPATPIDTERTPVYAPPTPSKQGSWFKKAQPTVKESNVNSNTLTAEWKPTTHKGAPDKADAPSRQATIRPKSSFASLFKS